MLKRFNMYLDPKIVKALEKIGKPKGLKIAQVIRMILSEYVKTHEREDK